MGITVTLWRTRKEGYVLIFPIASGPTWTSETTAAVNAMPVDAWYRAAEILGI